MKRTISRSWLVIGTILAVTGCTRNKKVEDAIQTTPTSGEQRAPLTVAETDEIINNPLAYDGKTVTIRGEIDKVISPRAFQLDTDRNLGRDEILVVMTDDNYGPTKGRMAEVTGTVRAYVEKEIEGEIDYDLDHEIFEEFDGAAVIIAKPENIKVTLN